MFSLLMFYYILTLFQAIEAQDPSHLCVEYWNHKVAPSGSVVDNFPFGSSSSLGNINTKIFGIDLIKQEKDNILEEMKSILQGASPDELRTMHKLIISDAQCCEWRVALIALMDEIRNARQ